MIKAIPTAPKSESFNGVADSAKMFSLAQDNWRSRHFQDIDNRYKAAQQTRTSVKLNGSPQGESANHDYQSEWDYFRMVAIGRQFDRDDLFAGALVTRLVDNVIQCGFTYNPNTGNRYADAILKTRVGIYESSPNQVDAAGRFDLHELARLSFRDMIVSGDIFHLKLKDGRLQTIENHRCRTPVGLDGNVANVTIHGVELDGMRRVQAYHFANDDIDVATTVRVNETTRVDARDNRGFRNVLHIVHPKRITQTRGVTKFASVSDAVPMHGDIQFAKMVQQQQVSVWTMIRTRALGFEYPDNVQEPYRLEEDPCHPGQTRSIQNLSPGTMYTGYPGEMVSGFSPNVPNPTFFDHAKQIQQIIGINLDIPLVMALLDGSETNFSGWRGAVEQAKLSFVKLQNWFASLFYREIILWKIRQWSDPNSPLADPFLVAMRQAGVNLFLHEWTLPSWPYIQPVEDATADVIKLRSGMTSLRRAHSARSQDYETVMQEIVEDRKAMIIAAKQAAKEINEAFPDDKDPAHWRDLASFPTSEGETLALPSVEPERMQKDKGAATNGQQPAK
jgi:capsid protein